MQKQVQQIRNWIEQVHGIETSLRTSNGILFVDCSNIQDIIIPGLQTIFTKLMDMTASHCLLSSEELIKELNDISKVSICRLGPLFSVLYTYKGEQYML